MPTPEVQSFFQGFNFDTLLALISCVTGVAALFVGGAAYKQCQINKNSFNDEKEYEDGSQDHSQKAGRDINNYGISDTQLATITTTLTSMTNANFSEALGKAYAKFQEQCDDNLKNIIEETKKVILDGKFQISGYTKIDWIHIYLESAKNTSDVYMQKVWAKVLACELAVPNSISYKTLDTLKNMSGAEFRLLEQLASISMHHAIIEHDELSSLGFDWVTLQRLKDYGLISLDGTQRTITVKAQSLSFQFIGNSHVIVIKNNNSENKTLIVQCYLLTAPAQELLSVVDTPCSDDAAIKVANAIVKADSTNTFNISLHKINFFLPDGRANYSGDDLLKNN